MDPKQQKTLADRRQFLRRMVNSALGIAGIGALGIFFWDRTGPRPERQNNPVDVLPDYSLTGQTGKLALIRGEDRGRNVIAAINALGGMAQFIRPGDRVLLKVNAAFAAPPMLGATTHPDLVTHVSRLCFEAGAASVSVTDNPINDPAACFALSGIDAAARAAGAQIILPTQDRFEDYSVPGAQLIQGWPVLTSPLRRTDKVIGLAPVKDHHRSGASMTLKNWYGLLGGRRNIFHQQIHTIISELAQLIKPTLVILDGTMSMIQNGPTGGSLDDLKATHTLIAGTDPVAVDAAGAELLGKSYEDLPYLAMAAAAGAGRVDWRSILVNGG
jgi:uncharacterized protein (DUF362 family)